MDFGAERGAESGAERMPFSFLPQSAFVYVGLWACVWRRFLRTHRTRVLLCGGFWLGLKSRVFSFFLFPVQRFLEVSYRSFPPHGRWRVMKPDRSLLNYWEASTAVDGPWPLLTLSQPRITGSLLAQTTMKCVWDMQCVFVCLCVVSHKEHLKPLCERLRPFVSRALACKLPRGDYCKRNITSYHNREVKFLQLTERILNRHITPHFHFHTGLIMWMKYLLVCWKLVTGKCNKHGHNRADAVSGWRQTL